MMHSIRYLFLVLISLGIISSLEAQYHLNKPKYRTLHLAQHHAYGSASPENYGMGFSLGAGFKDGARMHLQGHLHLQDLERSGNYSHSLLLGMETRIIFDLNASGIRYNKRPNWTAFILSGTGFYVQLSPSRSDLVSRHRLLMPLGAGLRYKCSKNFDLEINYIQRFPVTHRLPESSKLYTGFSSLSVQLTYIIPYRVITPRFR